MAFGLVALGALCTVELGRGAGWEHNLSKPTPEGSEPPLAPLMPPLEGNSCWLWEAVDLFKLEGKQRQGSLGRRGGSGAGGRRGGWCVPWPGCGGGLGGKPCTPPCRGSSLLGPEEARSPVLICTYPYTRSCRCKGSTGGLIGH